MGKVNFPEKQKLEISLKIVIIKLLHFVRLFSRVI